MFIRLSEPIAFQDHDKEILGEILRLLHGITVAANEQEDRSPVGSAKLSQRFARLLFIRVRVGCGKNQAPACGSEHTQLGWSARRRFRFHQKTDCLFFRSFTSIKTFIGARNAELVATALWAVGSGTRHLPSPSFGMAGRRVATETSERFQKLI